MDLKKSVGSLISGLVIVALVLPSSVVAESTYVDETVHPPGKVVTMGNLDVELVTVRKGRDGLTFMQKQRSEENTAFVVSLVSRVNSDNIAYPLRSVHLIGPDAEKQMKPRTQRMMLVGTPTELHPGEIHRKDYKLVTKNPGRFTKIRVESPEAWGDSDYVRYFDVSRAVEGSSSLKPSLSADVHSPGSTYTGENFTVTVHGLTNHKVEKINGDRYQVTYEVDATLTNTSDESQNANVQEKLFLQHPAGYFAKPAPNLSEDGYLGQIVSVPANESRRGLLEYNFKLGSKPGKAPVILRLTHFSYSADPPFYWKIPVD